MLKILLKAAVLFLIVLSIYLIVNPMACSNMLAGRERTDQSEASPRQDRQPKGERQDSLYNHSQDQDELLAPQHESDWDEEGIFDTNTIKEATQQPTYSQDDIDRAIATRYVELEREYARDHKVGKDMSRELSTIVMSDFEMTRAEWESFLARATASDLFNKVRQSLPDTTTSSTK